jgi:iron complex transport system substrate-binding protein
MRVIALLLLLCMTVVPLYAQRIVSLAPSVTEMLYAIGAGGSVVGVDGDSNYPSAVNSLPKIDGYDTYGIEAILALNPSLVVGWEGGTSPELIEDLERMGIKVMLVNTPTLADIGQAMQQLGMATGHIESADQAANLFQQKLTQLSQRYGAQPSYRTVMIELSDRPLYVATQESIQSQVIKLCGGINVFQSLRGEAQMVTVERVLSVDPQVIIALTPISVNDWSQWTQLPAVQNKRMKVIDADLLARNGPRILQGAEQVCEVING